MAKDRSRGSFEDKPALEEVAFAKEARAGLRRVEAPTGFTERLMARAELRDQARPFAQGAKSRRRDVVLRFARPTWRVAYAAAAVLALAAGTLRVEYRRTEQRRADVAAAQLDTALAVTNHALDHVSAKLETTEFGEVQRALEMDRGGR